MVQELSGMSQKRKIFQLDSHWGQKRNLWLPADQKTPRDKKKSLTFTPFVSEVSLSAWPQMEIWQQN